MKYVEWITAVSPNNQMDGNSVRKHSLGLARLRRRIAPGIVPANQILYKLEK
jgi:hypothetical protein